MIGIDGLRERTRRATRWVKSGLSMITRISGEVSITAPTVNSYKRFWDFGFWAPIYKDYGWQNRTCLVRVASGGRFEYRAVDSASATTVLLLGSAPSGRITVVA